jgi:hypothetical protein
LFNSVWGPINFVMIIFIALAIVGRLNTEITIRYSKKDKWQVSIDLLSIGFWFAYAGIVGSVLSLSNPQLIISVILIVGSALLLKRQGRFRVIHRRVVFLLLFWFAFVWISVLGFSVLHEYIVMLTPIVVGVSVTLALGLYLLLRPMDCLSKAYISVHVAFLWTFLVFSFLRNTSIISESFLWVRDIKLDDPLFLFPLLLSLSVCLYTWVVSRLLSLSRFHSVILRIVIPLYMILTFWSFPVGVIIALITVFLSMTISMVVDHVPLQEDVKAKANTVTKTSR